MDEGTEEGYGSGEGLERRDDIQGWSVRLRRK